MTGETFGVALARLRDERGLSLRALAKLIPYTHVYVWELEKGRKPPTAQVAEFCDDALDAAGVLSSATDVPPSVGSDGGLHFSHSLEEGVDVAVRLWREDASRRRFLHTVAFTASAFTAPAAQWLSGPIFDPVKANGSRLIGMPDVEVVREMTRAYRRLDNRYGGGHARPTVVRYLHAEVAPLLKQGRYDAKTGSALMGATAELTQLAGWMAYDDGAHGLAQRCFIQALSLARGAQDRALGAEVLAAMSHQAVYLGNSTEGVGLARSARTSALQAGIPAIVAEAEVMEAHSHATAGDERACVGALDAAERSLDRADRSSDPQWIGYFDEAYLSAKFGHCFAALRQGHHVERFARRSLDMDDRYVRGRAFNLTLLARSFLMRDQPEPEQAAVVGTQALVLAEGMRSARANDYLRGLADQLAKFGGLPEVAKFLTSTREYLRSACGEQYSL